MLLCFHVVAHAAVGEGDESYVGQPIQEVIDNFRHQGYKIIYSTQLVPATLRVKSEPSKRTPMDLIAEVLKPYGLTLRAVDGLYLVVRAGDKPGAKATGSLTLIVLDEGSRFVNAPVTISAKPRLSVPERVGAGVYQYTGLEPGRYRMDIDASGYQPIRKTVEILSKEPAIVRVKLKPGVAELETVTVSTSRYVLFSNSKFYVDQRALENLPSTGDDPMRAIHRLPGAAAGGWSAKAYVRGGEENESAIYLNGLQLLDPFHVRDYQSIFSVIDAHAISGVEAYTGGFPAKYGDHMSGMMLLRSQEPEIEPRTELGVSVFNTSLLTTDYSKDDRIDWLISARRSNLGNVLDKHVGRLAYTDVFVSVGYDFSPDSRLVLNGLWADDGVLVITDNDPANPEKSYSDTRNDNLWLVLDNQWTDELASTSILSWTSFDNQRNAFVHDHQKLIADVNDLRDAVIVGLKQDWTWRATPGNYLQWGFEVRHEQADYHYVSEARYSGFDLAYPNARAHVARDITASFDGYRYALYVADRIDLWPDSKIELGLRWDRQTFARSASGKQLSPRASLFHHLGSKMDFRLTWGRYYQSQGIQALQIEDGVEHFFPAQRADQLIAGIHYRPVKGLRIRVEAYQKNYEKLRPRFENLLNTLALIPEAQPDRVRIAPDSARARGLELTLGNRDDERLDWWIAYTWSRATDVIGGRRERRSWDQRHAFQAGLAWHRKPWEFGLAVNVHTGWPTTGLEWVHGSAAVGAAATAGGNVRVQFGPRNAENLGTFASIDLRLSRYWTLGTGKLSAFFELSNATDRKNECCVDYTIEQLANDRLVLDKKTSSWPPILPAAGLTWKF